MKRPPQGGQVNSDRLVVGLGDDPPLGSSPEPGSDLTIKTFQSLADSDRGINPGPTNGTR